MTGSGEAVLRDLVLVGGGHSHVAVLRQFGMRPLPGVRITLICREPHTPYSGMLPGLIAGHYAFDETHIDLRPLCSFAGARFYADEVVGVDLAEQRVQCRGRPPVPYDVISFNVGSTPATAGTPGAEGHAVPVKPIQRFVKHWEELRKRVLAREEPTQIGVVGAGAGGVELVLAVQHRLSTLLAERERSAEHLTFHLLSAEPEILSTHGRAVAAKFERVLDERGIRVHRSFRVASVGEREVASGAGERLALDEILWVTQAAAAAWLRESGLAVDSEGFMCVADTLESTSHAHVFGVGDTATVVRHPRPKSGVFAVRQGPPLARNLRRALLGQPLRPFRPQKHALSLISTGDRYAIASRAGWSAEGAYLWTLKDWIDRRFMRQYSELPDMPEEQIESLPAELADAETIPLASVERPDDAHVVAVPAGRVMVQSVSSLRAFVDDPYLLGRIAANHSLGDLHAMGSEPQSALAIASVPHGTRSQVEETSQMMAGALEVLRDAKVALAGEHTREGAELSLGFAVNGLSHPERLLRKSGMRPGDALLLNKPIGTGILFAADMRRKAKGRWIQAALTSMQLSNRAASEILLSHGASACTHIAGFGLLGHLLEMVRRSQVDVDLWLDAIPLLEGARETVARGILSSLQPQNVRVRSAIRNLEEAAKDPRYPLLFDPQIAGGLLASVPAERVEECVTQLRDAGYERAARIGLVKAQSEHLEPVVVR